MPPQSLPHVLSADKLSNNVLRDLETANASQEEFDREQELQAKMEENLNATMVIVKTITDRYEKLQEEERAEASKNRGLVEHTRRAGGVVVALLM